MTLAAKHRPCTGQDLPGILAKTAIPIFTNPDNRQPLRHNAFH